MQNVTKQIKFKLTIFKGIRLLFIPLSIIMFYFATKAWGDGFGVILALLFGGIYFLIVNGAIVDLIGGEIKNGIEDLIKRVTASPVHIEFGRAWGRMSFLIFLQEENETVTKVIYRKLVEKLKGSEYFNKIEIVSMANVPNLEKETIKKFKALMIRNAFEATKRKKG
ncbi:MAG: hypothetical protein ACK5MV_04595 [Aminipila sp.]